MEYKILWRDNLLELENAVNNHIKLGFVPTGGVCVRTVDSCYQAMIRE